jgi:hypothetical protein
MGGSGKEGGSQGRSKGWSLVGSGKGGGSVGESMGGSGKGGGSQERSKGWSLGGSVDGGQGNKWRSKRKFSGAGKSASQPLEP